MKYLSIVKFELKLTKSNKKINLTIMKYIEILKVFAKILKDY